MKIYTDEFMEAIEKIEKDVDEEIYQWTMEIGQDSMIESRNLSIGDSNEFGKDFFVNLERYEIDISDYLYSRRVTVDEISNAICKKVKQNLNELVEKKIEESETTITRIKDVRKSIKVVAEGDTVIKPSDLTLSFRIGIKEYNRMGEK